MFTASEVRIAKKYRVAERTVDFLKAGFPRNGRGGMLVEGTPVTAELKLLPDADFLVAEDCGLQTRLVRSLTL